MVFHLLRTDVVHHAPGPHDAAAIGREQRFRREDVAIHPIELRMMRGQILPVLEIAKEVGMTTRVLFMIRTPGQTKNTVATNIRWLKRVPYDIIACTSFVPIPGSDIWINPDRYNIEILNRNLDDYNFYFFGKSGENELKDIIKIKDRPLDEFNAESKEFRDYLKETGKLNQG